MTTPTRSGYPPNVVEGSNRDRELSELGQKGSEGLEPIDPLEDQPTRQRVPSTAQQGGRALVAPSRSTNPPSALEPAPWSNDVTVPRGPVVQGSQVAQGGQIAQGGQFVQGGQVAQAGADAEPRRDVSAPARESEAGTPDVFAAVDGGRGQAHWASTAPGPIPERTSDFAQARPSVPAAVPEPADVPEPAAQAVHSLGDVLLAQRPGPTDPGESTQSVSGAHLPSSGPLPHVGPGGHGSMRHVDPFQAARSPTTGTTPHEPSASASRDALPAPSPKTDVSASMVDRGVVASSAPPPPPRLGGRSSAPPAQSRVGVESAAIDAPRPHTPSTQPAASTEVVPAGFHPLYTEVGYKAQRELDTGRLLAQGVRLRTRRVVLGAALALGALAVAVSIRSYRARQAVQKREQALPLLVEARTEPPSERGRARVAGAAVSLRGRLVPVDVSVIEQNRLESLSAANRSAWGPGTPGFGVLLPPWHPRFGSADGDAESRAANLLLKGDWPAAKAAYEALLVKHPGKLAFHFALAEVAERIKSECDQAPGLAPEWCGGLAQPEPGDAGGERTAGVPDAPKEASGAQAGGTGL